MAEVKNIIPRAIRNNIRLIQTKQEGGMATEKDKKLMEKYKKLYPSMF